MTAQQLFDLTVGLMGITPANATSYADVIIPQMNTILTETFNLENTYRQANDIAVLTVIPTVTALTDVLTYQDSVLRNAVCYGIAQLLSVSDGEFAMANFFSDKYESGKRLAKRIVQTEIKDYYSGEE